MMIDLIINLNLLYKRKSKHVQFIYRFNVPVGILTVLGDFWHVN